MWPLMIATEAQDALLFIGLKVFIMRYVAVVITRNESVVLASVVKALRVREIMT